MIACVGVPCLMFHRVQLTDRRAKLASLFTYAMLHGVMRRDKILATVLRSYGPIRMDWAMVFLL